MNNTQTSGGAGFTGLLFLLFLGLKLTGYIDWSWWWVTAPLWVPFAIFLVTVAIMGSIWLFTMMKMDR